MSISKFQEKFLGKGCGVVIGVVCAVLFLGMGLNQCGRGASMGQVGQTGGGSVAVTVGDVPIEDRELDAEIQQETSQQMQSNPAMSQVTLPFEEQSMIAAESFIKALGFVVDGYIAQRDHIPVDDASLTKAALGAEQQYIDQKKATLKVPPNATPVQVEQAFKAAYGQTPDQILATQTDNLKKALADKDKRAALARQLTPLVILDSLAAKLAPSEQELRAGFDTYVIKRIFIPKKGGKNQDDKAKQALAAVQGGGSFEAAMDKFSEEPPSVKGKKVSENTIRMPSNSLDAIPDYKGLKGQKPGFVSGLVDSASGQSIYKIVSIQNDAPKDFAKNPEKYRLEFGRYKAQSELQKQHAQVLSSSVTQWGNAGYKALYDFYTTETDPNQANKTAALQKVVDEANAAIKNSSGPEARPATFALYDAFDAIYRAPGADKTKLRDQRIDVLNKVLAIVEDYALRMELVDLYVQKKDGLDALSNLVLASRSNTVYDTTGQAHFGDIAAKRAQLLAIGLVKQTDLADLDKEQTAWKAAKVEADKQAIEEKKEEAEQKRQAEEQAKKDAENEKKNAELLKQQQAQQKKAGGKAPADTSAGKLLPGSTSPAPSSSGQLLPPGALGGH